MKAKEVNADYLHITGCKYSEAGMIPEDWDVKKLGGLIYDFRGGASLKPSDFTKNGIKVLPKVGIVPGGLSNVGHSRQHGLMVVFRGFF